MASEHPSGNLELSRRKLLLGTGAIGAAGIGAGFGSSALFSESEQFANNQLVAGELDMNVCVEEHYFRDQNAAMAHAHREDGELVIDDHEGFMNATLVGEFPDKVCWDAFEGGTADPCELFADVPDDRQRPLIELDDVKPGDFGEVTFSFALCDNPGYVWMNGSLLENAENGLSEPEADASNENDGDGTADPGAGDETSGELADAIQTTIWYDDECDNLVDGDEELVFRGSLRSALRAVNSGSLFLDADPGSDDFACFEPGVRHCVGFRWELPRDEGNATQSDSVVFDLGFGTEQCRNTVARPEEGDPVSEIEPTNGNGPLPIASDAFDDKDAYCVTVCYPMWYELEQLSLRQELENALDEEDVGGVSAADLTNAQVSRAEDAIQEGDLGKSLPFLFDGTLVVVKFVPCTAAGPNARAADTSDLTQQDPPPSALHEPFRDFAASQPYDAIRRHEEGHAKHLYLTWQLACCYEHRDVTDYQQDDPWTAMNSAIDDNYHDIVGGQGVLPEVGDDDCWCKAAIEAVHEWIENNVDRDNECRQGFENYAGDLSQLQQDVNNCF